MAGILPVIYSKYLSLVFGFVYTWGTETGKRRFRDNKYVQNRIVFGFNFIGEEQNAAKGILLSSHFMTILFSQLQATN